MILDAMPPEEKNTFHFIRMLSLPQTQKILRLLQESPKRYLELVNSLYSTRKSSKTAYYLRLLLRYNCIIKKAKQYHITWKGIKTIQIYTMINQFQNTDMSNYTEEYSNTEFVQIQSTRPWLEPYLEKKIKQILNTGAKRVRTQ